MWRILFTSVARFVAKYLYRRWTGEELPRIPSPAPPPVEAEVTAELTPDRPQGRGSFKIGLTFRAWAAQGRRALGGSRDSDA